MSSKTPSWVFGYGSLVWRPAFAFAEREPAVLHGWARRFWQGSTDHRGVPGAPGRVATLVPEPGASCWGMGYRLEQAQAEQTLERLDVREQGGYQRHRVWLRLPRSEREVEALLYVAGPDNPCFLGPAPVETMAAQVQRSEGPSGHNVEYVLRLAEALRSIGAEDPHVFELAAAVRDGSR